MKTFEFSKQEFMAKRAFTATWVMIFILALLPVRALAEGATASVSQNVVEVNEPFQLIISVDENVGNSALNLNPLSRHFKYGSPHLSNSTSIINGTVSRLTEWRLMLVAKEEGKFTIPSFDIQGKITNPITVTVKKTLGAKKIAQDSEAIQVIVNLDKNKGYIGETFIYHVRLMIGTRVESPSLQPPSGKNIEVEQVGDDVQAEGLVNGRRYIIVSRQYQITPTAAGNLKLKGAIFNGTEVTSNRWGTSLGLPVSKQAQTLTLDIKEKPADYKGLWLPTPNLELSQYWEPKDYNQPAGKKPLTAKVGEPINRIITLKIKNIAQSAMPDLNLNYPNMVRVYSDKPEHFEEDGYRVMRVKQVIIPRQQGQITLPSISINWFNTETGKEQVSEIPTLNLVVEADDVLLPEQNEQPLITRIPVVPQTPDLNHMQEEPSFTYWPFITAFFALLWIITLILYLKQPNLVSSPKVKTLPTDNNQLKNLIAAAKSNDILAMSTFYNQWDNLHLSENLRQRIDNEIKEAMTSHYSKENVLWKNKPLLELLEKARHKKTTAGQKEGLKPLK